jgi:hypothetical protein
MGNIWVGDLPVEHGFPDASLLKYFLIYKISDILYNYSNLKLTGSLTQAKKVKK